MTESQIHHRMVREIGKLCGELFDWHVVEANLGPNIGIADVIAGVGLHRLVIEVERRPDRIGADVKKAAAVGADLMVVTPDERTAQQIRRRLSKARVMRPRTVVVSSYGVAAKRLEQFVAGCCHPVVEGLEHADKKPETGGRDESGLFGKVPSGRTLPRSRGAVLGARGDRLAHRHPCGHRDFGA